MLLSVVPEILHSGKGQEEAALAGPEDRPVRAFGAEHTGRPGDLHRDRDEVTVGAR